LTAPPPGGAVLSGALVALVERWQPATSAAQSSAAPKDGKVLGNLSAVVRMP
jgi:hypothetical protein